MKPFSTHRRRRLAWLLWLSLLPAALGARAEVLVSDHFESAAQDEAGQKIQSVIPWFVYGAAGSQLPSPATVKDKPALQFSGQSQKTLLAGNFPRVTLRNPGDSIKLSVVYFYEYPPGSNQFDHGFAIGLYDSGGMALTSGNLRVRKDSPDECDGYLAVKMPNAAQNDLRFAVAHGLLADFPAGSPHQGDSEVLLNDARPHTLTLVLTLEAAGVVVASCQIDGRDKPFRIESGSKPPTSLDTILIAPIGRGLGSSTSHKTVYVSMVELSSASGGKP